MARWSVPNTEHPHQAGATVVGAADLEREIEVTVMLRENQRGPSIEEGYASVLSGDRPAYTDAELRRKHGASFTDIMKVRAFAATHGLKVDEHGVNQTLGTVRLRGTVAQCGRAFEVTPELYEENTDAGTRLYRSHAGAVSVPSYLRGAVTAVVGLTDRERFSTNWRAADRAQAVTARNPGDLAASYGFPPIDATGVVIGIGQFGGQRVTSDFEAAMISYGIPRSMWAKFVDVGVNGAPAAGVPDPAGADRECALDGQTVAAILQGATVVWVTATNDDQGALAMRATLLHGDNLPAGVSIPTDNSESWNGPEDQTAPASMDALEKVTMMGAMVGRNYFQSSGDGGSTNGVGDGLQHVLTCTPSTVITGATTLDVDAAGKRIGETAWPLSGGGVSTHFPVPAYQSATGANPVNVDTGQPGRGAPDWSLTGDPASGANVFSGGVLSPTGGSSLSSPLGMSITAGIRHLDGGPKGPFHGVLYAMQGGPGIFDVVTGNNGLPAGPRWDPASGVGSPGPEFRPRLTTTTPVQAQLRAASRSLIGV